MSADSTAHWHSTDESANAKVALADEECQPDSSMTTKTPRPQGQGVRNNVVEVVAQARVLIIQPLGAGPSPPPSVVLPPESLPGARTRK